MVYSTVTSHFLYLNNLIGLPDFDTVLTVHNQDLKYLPNCV